MGCHMELLRNKKVKSLKCDGNCTWNLRKIRFARSRILVYNVTRFELL